jgi:hypothetical protein
MLTRMRDPIFNLWKHWDDDLARQIGAVNLLRDIPGAQRRADIGKLRDEVGECAEPGPISAENWLRGQFTLTCAKGTVGVFFTLSPTQPPAVQHLSFHKLESPSQRLGAPTGPPAGVMCAGVN